MSAPIEENQMTAARSARSPEAELAASSLQGSLVGLIDTLDSAEYRESSPAFQPLARVDVAVLIGLYVLVPVVLAIAVWL
jgi:hypothetical protein